MIESCPFCNIAESISEKIYSYEHWNLFLQPEKKRRETRQAAGFLASKRHEAYVKDAHSNEWEEVRRIIADASRRLSEYVGLTYADQEIVGFNKGIDAGQTVQHAHIHILPVAEEYPAELKGRAGIGAAFEALHRERLNDEENNSE